MPEDSPAVVSNGSSTVNEGSSPGRADAHLAAGLHLIPGSHALADVCAQLAAKVDAFLESRPDTEILRQTQLRTRDALGVVQEALKRYSLRELSLSYNGGKDCLVLLILLLAALHRSPHPLPQLLPSVYIISPHPFAEVDEFVDASAALYRLDLARYTLPMKQSFTQYLKDFKEVKAILVGTRRTDPHGEKLGSFDRTDSGWPDFVRVHPVLDWHYVEIWAFIRALEIPYCKLYDQGYTSLGGTTDTHPNPVLKAGEEGTEQKFRPAYELVEDEAERLGRDWH